MRKQQSKLARPVATSAPTKPSAKPQAVIVGAQLQVTVGILVDGMVVNSQPVAVNIHAMKPDAFLQALELALAEQAKIQTQIDSE